MSDGMFKRLPQVPDHPALEHEILEWWDRERVFDRLREQNAGGARWHFLDGPITANNAMGIHHAWGRTLKDVFVRYKALRGFDQRYQNGFDCQGLWVEVEVEKALGLNSKRDIEDYGLAEFAERCKERVAHYAEVITQQDRRLGRWMDWDNDYYTFSDTNIEYIWRFLKTVHERGWLYKGHRSTQWCPRCGTSLSQHEQTGEDKYTELSHPSLFVRFPLKDREDESLLVWTTTPWTLPANVAAAVKPDADYVLTTNGEWSKWESALEGFIVRRARGEELVGLEYAGPFDDLPAQQGIEHRVIPWEDVALDEGTGIVHIAPGCGAEDFELSRAHDLPVVMPINEAGRFYEGFGDLTGKTTDEVEQPIVDSLRARGLLVKAGRITHRYPICWRCATPLVFRIVDDWFISAQEIREQMLAANQTVAWTPPFYGKRMDDWLRNMGDWNISRKRYFGLPLPFYPCAACGKLNVVGSRAELEERATGGLDQLQELHRPWIDEIAIRCECGEEVRRIPEVGDAWLDAGIVPFSTLGWQNSEWIPRGYATGASEGVSGADLPDHAYWEQWFPADWISESREQIRLWFYSMLFMSVTLEGRAPYRAVLAYERVRDETGREMHKSWGNAIEANEALERMGADIVRWLFSEQPPSQNVNFGYGPADELKRRLLTLWNSVSFFVTYANIDGFRPRSADLDGGPEADLAPLDRWLVARTNQLVAETEREYERYWTPGVVRAFEAFVEDLSNWYIRRSRPRFWRSDETALRTLWFGLVQALRVISPVMPFLADFFWRNLAAEDGPDSVFLAGWPAAETLDEDLLVEVAETRRVVELGRQARSKAGIRLRQPLSRVAVEGAPLAAKHEEEIANELRVREVVFGEVGTFTRVRFRPNYRLLGPRLGPRLRAVESAIKANDVDSDGDTWLVAGEKLSSEELIVDRLGPVGSEWSVAEDSGVVVAVDTSLDADLELEGRVLDLIHRLNAMRKEAGLELTDRIVVTLPADHAELLAHEDRIKDEVLAVEIRTDHVAEPQIARAT